jgi:hypothetical protein
MGVLHPLGLSPAYTAFKIFAVWGVFCAEIGFVFLAVGAIKTGDFEGLDREIRIFGL